MIQWPLSVFLLGLIFAQEIFGSGMTLRRAGQHLWRLSLRVKTPSKEQSALLFAALASVSFALWESLLRFMLQAEAGWLLSLVGATALFALLGWRHFQLRAHSKNLMTPLQFLIAISGFALFIQAWIAALIIGIWVYWRASKVRAELALGGAKA